MLCFQKEGSLLLKNKTKFSNLVVEVIARIFYIFFLKKEPMLNSILSFQSFFSHL